ncbi:MAG TPA: helix-turn-helix domain-containing protein [Polyangiales bacterium]
MSGEHDPKRPKPTGPPGVSSDELELLSEPPLDEDSVLDAEAERRALPEPAAIDVEVESPDAPPRLRPKRVVAIAGARGGVGKTVLASNLALYLATIGRRVILVDADPSGANLHTCLGMRKPASLARAGRMGVRRDGTGLIEEALVKTPFPGLRLLHAGLDDPGPSVARAERLVKLVEKLRTLEADYVVLDIGVGWGREVVDAYLAADLPIFVTVPEPTALENTYQFLRAAFARYVLLSAKDTAERDALSKHLKALGSAPPPLDLLKEVERQRLPLVATVQAAMESFRPSIVISQTRLRADLQLGFDMQSAARRRLGLAVEYMGHIDHDDTVWTCVRNRRPLLLEVPGAKSSKKLEKIARRVLASEAAGPRAQRVSAVPLESHHDVLEVERGATEEEIRRAYKRCRELYAHDSLACYGLLEPHEIETLRARLDEAFDVLLDPARRRPYELSVFPPSMQPPPQPAAEPAANEEPRALPEITPDTVFTGPLLRQVREAHRVSLRDVSQKTKIGLQYLKAIEDDDFAHLPAVVYVSGFLSEFAKSLKLDAQQVSRTYVRRYKRYLEDKDRGLASR